ncbi:MAG: hypothetical protein ACYTEZ_16860 [Planctomycetota bacterium]|jgi:hypothetical protein
MRTLALLALLAAALQAAEFADVDRRLAREPRYVAQPLYALFLFGPKAKTKVWAVLDKSRADLAFYDVCYFDRNANGDLTEKGERFTAAWNERGARAGMAVVLRLGDFQVPGTDVVHTDLRISTVRKKGRRGIWFKMKWRGEHDLSGGQTIDGHSTAWGKTPQAAPILRPTLAAPLAFELYGWGAKQVTLAIGGETKVYLMAGVRGSRRDTLLVVDELFLKKGRDRIFATLMAKTRDGRDLEVRTEITGHC